MNYSLSLLSPRACPCRSSPFKIPPFVCTHLYKCRPGGWGCTLSDRGELMLGTVRMAFPKPYQLLNNIVSLCKQHQLTAPDTCCLISGWNRALFDNLQCKCKTNGTLTGSYEIWKSQIFISTSQLLCCQNLMLSIICFKPPTMVL